MRPPDNWKTIEHKGMTVQIKIWSDPEDMPYDGENPEDAEGCEGWILRVEAHTFADGFTFEGADILGGIWIKQGEKLTHYEEQVTATALAALEADIAWTANGARMQQARRAYEVANKILGKTPWQIKLPFDNA